MDACPMCKQLGLYPWGPQTLAEVRHCQYCPYTELHPRMLVPNVPVKEPARTEAPK